MQAGPSRVVVWSSGGVGSIAIDAVHRRRDLELVGVWVHSQDKVGRDAGELAGGEAIGISATNDADALINLRPDCVVYAASGPERDAGAVPDYLRLLAAGINVVSTTSTSLIYPPAYYSPDWRHQLDAAAKSGSASFYGSGIFPGFGSDQLALLLATQSKKIRCITATEIALNDHYPVADVMMNGLGFGHPLDFEPLMKTPGFIEMAWAAPIHLMADGLGVEVEEVRGSLDRRLTDRDIEVAFGTVKAGTCGAVLTRATGVVNGREAIVIEHIIRMARDVDEPRRRPRPRRRQGGDGCHGHAGGQRDSVRHRRTAGAAELAGHPNDIAQARVRLIASALLTLGGMGSSALRPDGDAAQHGVAGVDQTSPDAEFALDVLG